MDSLNQNLLTDFELKSKSKMMISKQIFDYERQIELRKKKQLELIQKQQIFLKEEKSRVYNLETLLYRKSKYSALTQGNVYIGKTQSSNSKDQILSPNHRSSQIHNQTGSTLKQKKSKKDLELEKPYGRITAKSFVVYCLEKNEILLSRRSQKERELASLTKIMTFYIAQNVINQFSINPADHIVKVSKRAASYKGTTAGLKPGDTLTLLDLLYGMMLPSGNDAAFAISEIIGRILIRGEIFNPVESAEPPKKVTSNQAVKAFVDEMNSTCEKLGLNSTSYANPHGLANTLNVSSAFSVATTVKAAMKSELFRQVVQTVQYKCLIKNQSFIQPEREIIWDNTNKIVMNCYIFVNKDNCTGVKTGFTPSAGPCLAASFLIPELDLTLIIVLLNVEGQDERFSEAQQLYQYTKFKLLNQIT